MTTKDGLYLRDDALRTVRRRRPRRRYLLLVQRPVYRFDQEPTTDERTIWRHCLYVVVAASPVLAIVAAWLFSTSP